MRPAFVATGLLCAIAACHHPSTALSRPEAPAGSSAAQGDDLERDPTPYLPDGCPSGEHDVRSWKRLESKAIATDQLFALNRSHCTWSVSIRDGIPIASPYVQKSVSVPACGHLPTSLGAPRVVQLGHAGVLYGYNHGEWGGALVWCRHDGSIGGQLLDDDVAVILPVFDRFVVLAGLDHLGSDRGQAVELLDSPAGFALARRTELGSSPRAALVEPSGAILVATSQGLLRITTEFHVHRLRDTDWGMLYPVSIALRTGGDVYVGMRGIVVELDLTTEPSRETWLFPR